MVNRMQAENKVVEKAITTIGDLKDRLKELNEEFEKTDVNDTSTSQKILQEMGNIEKLIEKLETLKTAYMEVDLMPKGLDLIEQEEYKPEKTKGFMDSKSWGSGGLDEYHQRFNSMIDATVSYEMARREEAEKLCNPIYTGYRGCYEE